MVTISSLTDRLDDNDTRIRKMTPSADVTTYAGTAISGFADGKADEAQFRFGSYLVADGSGKQGTKDGNPTEVLNNNRQR